MRVGMRVRVAARHFRMLLAHVADHVAGFAEDRLGEVGGPECDVLSVQVVAGCVQLRGARDVARGPHVCPAAHSKTVRLLARGVEALPAWVAWWQRTEEERAPSVC